jgi:hypothetical protein
VAEDLLLAPTNGVFVRQADNLKAAKYSFLQLDAVHVAGGMANIVRAVAVQFFQIAFREKAAISQHDKQRFSAVAFALDVIVVIEIVESLGPYAQDAVIEDIEDVYTGEVTTGMPAPEALMSRRSALR